MVFIPVYRAKNEIEAISVKGFLENGGISTVVIKADVSNYAGRIDGVPLIGSVPQIILVPEEEVKETKGLLKNIDEKA